MNAAASLELAIVAGSLASGTIALIAALRTRAVARADRLALRLAQQREAAFIEASRRLAVAARTSVDAVHDEIARATGAVSPGVDGILVYEARDGALTCTFALGERLSYFAGSRLALDDAAALPVRALACGHRATLAEEGARPMHPADVAAIAMPLALDAERACVVVFCARTPLEPEIVDRLATLADQVAPAYQTALDRETDRRSAEYDALTGLLTPRAFRRRLGALIERTRHVPDGRLALLFVDTDHFKQWNDSYGHAAGDALLRELANVLRAAARSEHDLIARNGGDEFCLVFTETGKADAIARAEALRARIASLDVAPLRPRDTAIAVAVTASIGVAAFPSDASNPSDLLERADAAMYHSKHGGRDGVSYAGPDGRLALVASGVAR